ncbi:hypothetical protein VSH64_29775 [Amycolatopsis rhabdoformis]|uniref:Preprotein translocase subunit SecG n=1 Tax=Amycolatopsis rhabdoformis TaxID=1448059 RepID=A0ABZ1HY35_9PSEU|nr:hypothetical protein [Amycolatopsis rhabdoformis]WSE27046.1 hypothetical protein VSH64_29775 [Amycolatopsis rhabdoformis]
MSFGVPAVAVAPLTASALFLAQQPDSGDNGGQGEDFGKSSPVGLLVLILFLIAVAFLIRSMSKHLKKVPKSFDQEEVADAAGESPEQEKAGEPVDTVESAAADPARAKSD